MQKKYIDIERFKISFTEGFMPGDHVVVQEKIDGANFSVCYDARTDAVLAFSRKTQLNEKNNLRGAWEWSQNAYPVISNFLPSHYVLFGEWLVPHSVKYPENCYHQAYFYDIYDGITCKWLPQAKVKKIVEIMGLKYVPVFYDGPFISWEHIRSFVGKTDLGGEMGEGVVIKNQDRLDDVNNKIPFYTKIVSEKFAEVHKGKPHVIDLEKIAAKEAMEDKAKTIVTEARVRKMVHKFVDEGIIPEDWSEKEMGLIAKNLGKRIYEDCMKEEPDAVLGIEGFGKISAALSMRIVKNTLLKER